MENPTTRGSPGIFFASEEDSRNQGGYQKKNSSRDRSVKEGVRKPILAARCAISLKDFFLNSPKLAEALAIFLQIKTRTILRKHLPGKIGKGNECLRGGERDKLGARYRWFKEYKIFEKTPNWRKPWRFFCQTRRHISIFPQQRKKPWRRSNSSGQQKSTTNNSGRSHHGRLLMIR